MGRSVSFRNLTAFHCRAAVMDHAFVGRHPIFESDQTVFGYELLFRAGDHGSADVSDGNKATTSVILNSLTDIGLDTLVGSTRAFINLTRDILLHEDLSFLPADRMVLEVLEDIEPDPAVLDALQNLRADGYTIALDDFIYCESLEPLVELADIVKLEFPATPRAEVAAHVARLRELGVSRILAEKIETQEDFELCRDADCDLFQGYFFCRPQVVSGRKVKSNVLALVRLISELQDPDITAQQVERIVQADANLSYKLLRFINSAKTGTTVEIESLQHAASLIGMRQLRALASMMLMSSLDDSKPDELITVAVKRARMCELLAEDSNLQHPERFYTLGLLSVMDAMLDLPMTEVIEHLPLAEDMNQALLEHTGTLGDVLQRVIGFETGDAGSAAGDVADQHLEALRWAVECRAAFDD